MTPNVSVIIPAYNAERYIAETLRSALDQTWTDLEVIVIDDGSADGTLARAAEFGDRVRVHRQANGGVARARNTGVGLARGEWIAFLDADDLWHPEKIEKQLACPDAPLSFTDRLNFGELDGLPELQSLVTPMRGGDIFAALLRQNFITTTSVLIRRDLFEELGGFDVTLKGTEDWNLWLRVAADQPIGFCPEPLVSYRLHRGGLSRNYARVNRERTEVIRRALETPRGRALDAVTRRRIWAETWFANGFDARRGGARARAFGDYLRSALNWPLHLQAYKEAVKVCLNA